MQTNFLNYVTHRTWAEQPESAPTPTRVTPDEGGLDPNRIVWYTDSTSRRMAYLADMEGVITIAIPGVANLIKLGRFNPMDFSQWPDCLAPCSQEPTADWEDAILAILYDHDIDQTPILEDPWDPELTSPEQLQSYWVPKSPLTQHDAYSTPAPHDGGSSRQFIFPPKRRLSDAA